MPGTVGIIFRHGRVLPVSPDIVRNAVVIPVRIGLLKAADAQLTDNIIFFYGC